jgi:ABC-type glucose/galactose transport system permease subunit
MNKYQIQALLDMGKVAIGIFAVIALVNGIIMLGMEATDIVAGISFAVMIYCLYQLFKIRVGQLESEDKEIK